MPQTFPASARTFAPAPLADAARGLLLSVGIGLIPTIAVAAPPAANGAETASPAIADGPLGTALERYAASTGLRLQYTPALVAGRRSAGLAARHAPDEDLARLLAGSGLQAYAQPDGSYRLQLGEDADGIAVVHVTGRRLGDQYAVRSSSAATRLPLSLRETPQSISVITQAEIQDFALQSVNDLLTHATGINVERVETDRTYYTARGFDITNFQVDGIGVPFANGNQWGDVDVAIYDRVEALRGANGLQSSTGNPSATINFVRKRPTAGLQGDIAATLGSWGQRRLDVDVSGALDDGGHVRGRIVGVAEHKDSYLDRYSRDKTVGYGIVEADLAPDTMLTLGFSQQSLHADSPMWGALPLWHSDGTPTHYDRSTSTSADWSYWDNSDQTAFAELSRRLGEEWKASAVLTRRRLEADSDLFYVYGEPDPNDGTGLFSYPSQFSSTETQWIGDVYAGGPFTLLGRRHDLMLGASWSKDDNSQLSKYNTHIGDAVPDLASWDGSFPHYAYDASSIGAEFANRRQSLYAAARWNLADALKLLTGANFTHAETSGESYNVQHQYQADDLSPYVGIVWDVAPHYSLYASYAQIFNPQTEVDEQHQVLEPIEGSNLEGGVKGEWLDRRLNASLAVFRVEQNNTAEAGGYDSYGRQFYVARDATSTGFEVDVVGEILPGWSLSAGYTQMKIEGPDGEDARTFVPRKTARLTTRYRLPMLNALRLGASVRWQDEIYRIDTLYSGAPVKTRQDAYAVLDLMGAYRITEFMDLTVNLNNVTDEKYLTSLYWSQSYYAAPRGVSATLSWQF
ncbi:TonB-dependent siderophore receptor [Solimonas flava]|uniref:TonB-dependent siderophore receptor n=1 Tax=Solimonas flava TaxID=415849 RepID=UPI0004174F35|nr:TonB-dependent siderophore receptor [Solimonas flava]